MVSGEGRAASPQHTPPIPSVSPVKDRRAIPGMAFGALALVLALLALVLSYLPLLVVAALAAGASVVLVLVAPDVPLRYRDRRRRQVETERLSEEADLMAARAARFEAEAVAARAALASAMLSVPHERGSGPWIAPAPDAATAEVLDAIESLETESRRRHDDPADAEMVEQRERKESMDEVDRLRRLQEGLTDGGHRTPDDNPPATPDSSVADPTGRITDVDSGLFNQLFFDASLDKRVSAARRGLRPLTVAFIEVVDRSGGGVIDPAPVAAILTETLREADTVARTADGLFAVLLEDTPENGAIWTLERIRRELTTELDEVVVRAGVSCYPAYAFTAEQLVDQARQALDDAREWNQDRIEVTTDEPDDA